MNNENCKVLYEKYARPSLTTFLKALKADVSYFKAVDCSLFYEEDGRTVEVLDATSGFGSALFGHNNPELKARIVNDLNNNVPFVVQGSIRGKAGHVCGKLNDMLGAITGKEYVSILCNTGAEAVETSIKVASFKNTKGKAIYLNSLNSIIENIKQGILNNSIRFDDNFESVVCKYLDIKTLSSIDATLDALFEKAKKTLDRSPLSISLKNGYHGKSTGALQLTHSDKFRGEFQGFGIPSLFVDPNDEDILEKELLKASLIVPSLCITDHTVTLELKNKIDVCALIFEPIQGEGGIRPISLKFLQKAKLLSKEHGFLLICDEIQTGIGRTGRFICSEKYDVDFDIYLLGKSLGGGLTKISSVSIEKQIYEKGFDVIHTTTFSEDELSSSVAIEVLKKIEDGNILKEVCEKGNFLLSELLFKKEKYPTIIKDVRGEGLLLGVELEHQELSSSSVIYNLSLSNMLGTMVASYLLNRHQIRIAATLSDGNIIRIQPSVTITTEQMVKLIHALDDVFGLIARADSGNLISHIIAPEKYQPDTKIDYSVSTRWLREKEIEAIKRRVTFIATPSSSTDIIDIDPSLERFSEHETDELIRLSAVLGIPIRLPGRVMEAANGEKIVFYLISVPYTPSMIGDLLKKGQIGQVEEIIDYLFRDSIIKGHTHFGLGSFTSIVTQNGLNLHSNKIGITTGNSLTVVSSADAMFKSAIDTGIDSKSFVLAIVGATGNIGSMYACYASDVCSQIVLIGRSNSMSRLTNVANQVYKNALLNPGKNHALYDFLFEKLGTDLVSEMANIEESTLFDFVMAKLGSDAPVKISTDLETVRSCNLVICTTNSPEKILYSNMVGKHETVISDVSFPPDVDRSVSEMPNTVVLHGGTVDISSVFDDRFRGIPTLGDKEAYACMSETILLALSGKTGHFSYGRLNINQLLEIRACAKNFGFIVDRPKEITNVFGEIK